MAFNIVLPFVMLGTGALCGSMVSTALGYKPWDKGGILGGIITGLAMYILSGGLSSM